MTWLNSTAGNCPLGANGIQIYGAFDMGFGYESHAAPFNRYYPHGVEEVIGKQSTHRRLARGAERPQPVEHRPQSGHDR